MSKNTKFIFISASIFVKLINRRLWVSKIALFDKALVSALACGALAMCAMWVGNCFKKCAVEKK